MGREARKNASQPEKDESVEEAVRSGEGGESLLRNGAEGEVSPLTQGLWIDTTKPYILFQEDEERQGLTAQSNIPQFEYIILRYARALKDQL